MAKKAEKLYFITGNKNKFEEVKPILKNVEQLELDLEEIQEVDAHKIIGAKLKEALKNHKTNDAFMIEDTSLYLDCLNGLPGPLIKWFLQKLGNEGIFNLTKKLGNSKAQAKTIIGYAKNKDEVYFFEGVVEGEIVSPSGQTSFGWDPIFKPAGNSKTFQEMSREEKNSISMRKLACEKLKDFLKKDI
jgi:non-canonical purine NTP pyrophosphatase (RdgB/HAM1 family)